MKTIFTPGRLTEPTAQRTERRMEPGAPYTTLEAWVSAVLLAACVGIVLWCGLVLAIGHIAEVLR